MDLCAAKQGLQDKEHNTKSAGRGETLSHTSHDRLSTKKRKQTRATEKYAVAREIAVFLRLVYARAC